RAGPARRGAARPGGCPAHRAALPAPSRRHAGGRAQAGHRMTVVLPGAGPRPLTTADLPPLLEQEREQFGGAAGSAGVRAEELAAPGRCDVGGDGDGRLVGSAGLWFGGDVTQVMTIGVDPAAQRGGLGTALLAALVARSRELGAQAVLLEVRV